MRQRSRGVRQPTTGERRSLITAFNTPLMQARRGVNTTTLSRQSPPRPLADYFLVRNTSSESQLSTLLELVRTQLLRHQVRLLSKLLN